MAIPRPILFAGTGVQLVFIPLRPELRYSAEQTGVGWQYCRCRVQDQVVELAYIQWQILRRTLILAVDTTVGTDDADAGYFAKANALGGDFVQQLSGLLGIHGAPLAGLPPIELTIRPATIEGGEPRQVHLVVDFGNSRTSTLLVEVRGDAVVEPLFMPAQLCSRHQLDCSDELADLARAQANWSFSSRTHWCTTPYLPPVRIERVQYRARPTGGLFRRMPLADSPANTAETAPIHARDGSIPPPERVADVEARTPRATPLRRLDENVQFTAFRPKAVRPACWHDLLVAAHLAEKRPDAPADEPEPIEKVRQLAEQLLGAQKDAYQEVVQDSRQAIPQGGEVTFVPEMDKVEFNPPRQSFLWEEDQHVTTFRLRASAELDRTVARGRVSVFLGAILVADIPLQIRVDSGYVATAEREKPEAVSARPYRKIFASYSHKDLAIVEQCERHAMVMGDRYLRDWKDLRAGEEWHPRLSEMIQEADVFQLFWSWQAMESEFVRQEWEHALALGRPNFVRPVYWETPFPERPGLPPEELRRIHFQCLCPETVHPAHTPPSLAAPRPEQRAASVGKVPSLLRGRAEPVPVTVRETPRTFEDFSMIRMGQDADDVADAIRAEGESRIGVSSPKRYLWAGDASWLAGADWLMADPFDRYDPEHHTTPLKGPFLRFLPEEDNLDQPQPQFEEAPSRPRHAPRTLMTAALYEILCQAYTFVNSISYRCATGVEQTRLLRSLTLTYPSGMIAAERVQLEKQALKALRIFMQTLGKSQPGEPALELSLDEATAVQLTYIWSELQKAGRRSRLWFSVMGRQPGRKPAAEADSGMPRHDAPRDLVPPKERDANSDIRQAHTTAPRRVDENVQFTAFRPKAVRPACWHDLLVAAHLAEKRPDAPADEPEPIEKVRQLAEQLVGQRMSEYRELTQDSEQAILRGGEMTFEPEMDQVEFNPRRQSFLWEEDQHVTPFRMRAGAELDHTVARGRISVFLGAILVADIPLQIRVDSGLVATVEPEKPEAVSARPYRKIFASYSHRDSAIVEQCERYVTMMGDRYLRDWKELRAGEEWNPRLSEMIEEADVFQLFWSQHAMESTFVRQEWEYALALGRPNFVRPVYWETPFPERPGLPPDELRKVHFQRLTAEAFHPVHTPPAADSFSQRPVVTGESPPRPSRPRAAARPMLRRRPDAQAPREDAGPEMRIASIDIGAGNSNLAIAKYTCTAGLGGDLIQGETLHREGIPVAGDHLVKRLLERIIVPQFADAVGLDARDAQALFGREVPFNSHFRLQRIQWVNRLFVPLAHAYLENAGAGIGEPLSHTDPDIVTPEVLQSLQDVINRLWGPGRYNIRQELSLCYSSDEFEEVVQEVFGDTFFDFCESVVEHRADIVLLAGRPSQLPHVQQLIETFLPLPASRIIPMSGRYAGTWYPYQGPDNHNPGLIIDPKSTVAVGAAVELMARHELLAGFRFRMSDAAPKESYYWGVMTGSLIHEDSVVFERRAEGSGASPVQRVELEVAAPNLFIGRRRRGREQVPASPAYLLRVLRGKRLGEINVRVTLARQLGPQGDEELVLESVVGDVDGEPAVQNRNVLFEWRTLADDHYYLDSGGLDQLELK